MKTLLGTLMLVLLSLAPIGCCTYNCLRERFCRVHNKIDACCTYEQPATYLSPPVIHE